jgi:hypothetical protein
MNLFFSLGFSANFVSAVANDSEKNRAAIIIAVRFALIGQNYQLTGILKRILDELIAFGLMCIVFDCHRLFSALLLIY